MISSFIKYEKRIYNEVLNVCTCTRESHWVTRMSSPTFDFHFGGTSLLSSPKRKKKPNPQEQQNLEPCLGARGVLVRQECAGSSAGLGVCEGQ